MFLFSAVFFFSSLHIPYIRSYFLIFVRCSNGALRDKIVLFSEALNSHIEAAAWDVARKGNLSLH